jgi:hypothetical protein
MNPTRVFRIFFLSARHAGKDGHDLLFLTPDKAKGCGSPKATAAFDGLEHDPEKWQPIFPRDKREAFARRSCSNDKRYFLL